MVLPDSIVEAILAEVVNWFPCVLSRLKIFPTDAVLESFTSIPLFAANTAMVDDLVNLVVNLVNTLDRRGQVDLGGSWLHQGAGDAQYAF
jgi:hypothetical protein